MRFDLTFDIINLTILKLLTEYYFKTQRVKLEIV